MNNKVNKQWIFAVDTIGLGDTGDYEDIIQFTNGKDILQTCGNYLDDDEIETFCGLLNKMPDLWSHRLDEAEFELSQIKKKVERLESSLRQIQDYSKTLLESDKEMIDNLKTIASKVINDIEQGLY